MYIVAVTARNAISLVRFMKRWFGNVTSTMAFFLAGGGIWVVVLNLWVY